MRPTTEWTRYLATYHDANPGITEDVLAPARDDTGRSPYDWLIEAVPAEATVVDVACGSGPVVRRFARRRGVGVDRSASELARARPVPHGAALVRADAARLPLATASADAVTASMALMVLHPLEAVLEEARRLLRPGGVLAATVPTRRSSDGQAFEMPVFSDILARLGQAVTPYPESLHPRSLRRRFSAAGLELVEDSGKCFVRPVGNDADCDLVVRSFYAPGAGADLITAAVEDLRRRARASPVSVTYRIRRLVALREGGGRRAGPKS